MRKAFAPMLLVAAGLGGCVDTQTAGQPASYGFASNAAVTGSVAVPARDFVSPKAEIPVGAHVVEFRSRTGPDIVGHSYLVYGTQGADGSIANPIQVGLYPKQLSGFAIGVGGMAEATTEPVSYDLSIPPSAVYRRQITNTEYARLVAAVEAARADPPTWNWTKYNCNSFIADMARAVDLKIPPAATLLAPAIFIHELKSMNS